MTERIRQTDDRYTSSRQRSNQPITGAGYYPPQDYGRQPQQDQQPIRNDFQPMEYPQEYTETKEKKLSPIAVYTIVGVIVVFLAFIIALLVPRFSALFIGAVGAYIVGLIALGALWYVKKENCKTL